MLRFEVSLPDPSGLQTALSGLGIEGVEVSAGEPAMEVEVASAVGTVTLESTAETLATRFGR